MLFTVQVLSCKTWFSIRRGFTARRATFVESVRTNVSVFFGIFCKQESKITTSHLDKLIFAYNFVEKTFLMSEKLLFYGSKLLIFSSECSNIYAINFSDKTRLETINTHMFASVHFCKAKNAAASRLRRQFSWQKMEIPSCFVKLFTSLTVIRTSD